MSTSRPCGQEVDSRFLVSVFERCTYNLSRIWLRRENDYRIAVPAVLGRTNQLPEIRELIHSLGTEGAHRSGGDTRALREATDKSPERELRACSRTFSLRAMVGWCFKRG